MKFPNISSIRFLLESIYPGSSILSTEFEGSCLFFSYKRYSENSWSSESTHMFFVSKMFFKWRLSSFFVIHKSLSLLFLARSWTRSHCRKSPPRSPIFPQKANFYFRWSLTAAHVVQSVVKKYGCFVHLKKCEHLRAWWLLLFPV